MKKVVSFLITMCICISFLCETTYAINRTPLKNNNIKQTTVIQSTTQNQTTTPMVNTYPIEPVSGVINNYYWGIIASDSSAGTNNAQRITAALNWAIQNGYSATKLDTNTYYINGINDNAPSASSNGIFVPSNMSFDLNRSTLIQYTNSSEGYTIINVIKASNVVVMNGTLIGDKPTHNYNVVSGTHEYGFGIDIRGSENVLVSNLSISQMTGDAVIIGGADNYLSKGGSISNNVTVSNCNISSCRRQGISVVGADTVYIKNNSIDSIGGTAPECGIDLEASLDWPVNNVVMSYNTFKNTAASAISFERNSSNSSAVSNTVYGHISVIFGENNSVLNNTVYDGGIFSCETDQVYNAMIKNNTLYNAYIRCATSQSMSVINNTVHNSYIIFGYCSGEVSGNTVTNTGDQLSYGILIYADGKLGTDAKYNVTTSKNTISGNYKYNLISSSFAGLLIVKV